MFSLAELEQCVIKGKLSRPTVLVDESLPIPASDEHYGYALGAADLRVHLALNNGSMSNPSTVYLLRPDTIEAQLNAASRAVLERIEFIDERRTLLLPKIFETHAVDFGSDVDTVRQRCEPFMDLAHGSRLLAGTQLVGDQRSVTIEYSTFQRASRSSLILLEDRAPQDDAEA